MRSRVKRFSSFFTYRRLIRWTGTTVLTSALVTGATTLVIGAGSCIYINRIRAREFTDDYHLNPEILRMPYRNVKFSTHDAVQLQGWWIPSTIQGRESDRIVILMHPYNNHKSNLLGIASALWSHGFSVFMFDFRSFCINPNTRQSIGYFEQFDARAAIQYVLSNYCEGDHHSNGQHYNNHHHNNNIIRNNSGDDDDEHHFRKQVVLMGSSMGGVCSILATQFFDENRETPATAAGTEHESEEERLAFDANSDSDSDSDSDVHSGSDSSSVVNVDDGQKDNNTEDDHDHDNESARAIEFVDMNDQKRKNRISAIVTDCAFSSLREVCKYRISIKFSKWLPVFLLEPIVYVMDIGNKYIYGYTVDDVDPFAVVNHPSFNIPLLLIHAECDTGVPMKHSQLLYNGCQSEDKNLYIVKSSNHCGGYFQAPQTFGRHVCSWVDRILDEERDRELLELDAEEEEDGGHYHHPQQQRDRIDERVRKNNKRSDNRSDDKSNGGGNGGGGGGLNANTSGSRKTRKFKKNIIVDKSNMDRKSDELQKKKMKSDVQGSFQFGDKQYNMQYNTKHNSNDSDAHSDSDSDSIISKWFGFPFFSTTNNNDR